MSTHVAKVWVMKKRFEGYPKLDDFEVREEKLPPLKDGEYLARAEWFSVDPYNRAFAGSFSDGTPMIGFQVAKVIESKNDFFKVGDHVVGQWGWRTLTVANSSAPPPVGTEYHSVLVPYKIPDLDPSIPLSTTVGVLGMPGATAYLGFLHCCKPRPGDTILVNTAAGAVGSAVGQIAKILGCKVIGFAGSEEKVAWLKQIGFDHAFNYKTANLGESIAKAAPEGVDCFFDNVGGEFAVTVYQHMRKFGRICQCGNIGSYNVIDPPKMTNPLFVILRKQLQLNGFIVLDYAPEWPEALSRMADWIKTGKLKYRESIYQGFDKMPQALIDQMYGKNDGKTVFSA